MNQPDTRGWALIGLFVLTAGIVAALVFKPDLQGNTLFVSIATLIVGSGGLLNAVGFYFGSSQGSAKKDEAIATMAASASAPPADPKDPQ